MKVNKSFRLLRIALCCLWFPLVAVGADASNLPQLKVADTQRLLFHVSQASSQGDLSQQTRRALESLLQQAGDASIIKLRAFVAGPPQPELIESRVREVFGQGHRALPVLMVVGIGALPDGAKIILESTAEAAQGVNPNGLAFISGQAGYPEDATTHLVPQFNKVIADLHTARRGVGLEPEDVLRLTCFLSTLGGAGSGADRLTSEFPGAAVSYMQPEATASEHLVECDAVARTRSPVREPLKLVNPDGLGRSSSFSQIALVGASKVALTGAFLAHGLEDADGRSAYEQARNALEDVGASPRHAAMSTHYPVSSEGRALVRKIRFDYYDRTRPPGSMMLLFEALPIPEASFALELVAPVVD